MMFICPAVCAVLVLLSGIVSSAFGLSLGLTLCLVFGGTLAVVVGLALQAAKDAPRRELAQG